MSRALDRHKMRKAHRLLDHESYARGLDALSGDDAGQGSNWGGLVASLAQAGGEIADTQMKRQAAEKKAQDDKAAALKRENEIKDAELAAENARNVATGKANEARLAALKAQAEREAFGPLHVFSQQAKDAADAADAAARKAEAKLAALRAGAPGSHDAMAVFAQMQKQARDKGGMPLWGWIGLGILGAGGVGFLGYKVFHKK